ncbi:MAG: histidinol-phosphate transaminase [Leptolinea sp.]|jgi:histidinol-phosphate aminotransferase|nr:histidinol-phosphate transaminase [Leptolinea sp.]
MKAGKRITDMAAYTPIEPVNILATRLGIPANQITKLDANENPYGPSPLVRQALAELDSINIYPDPESRVLRSRLSEVYDVPFENILTGSGADELIDLLVRVVVEPGDRVINCVPTFGMYDFDTALNFGVCLNIPRRSNFSLDMKAIEKAVKKEQPGIIFACSPNNPDGRRLTGEETDFLLSLPALIVLDEAYIEFTQQNGDLGVNNSLIRQVTVRDNLIVLRTFSKWAGLAGLRIGFGVFPTWLMDSLWKAKQPYNVNVAASAAACASLQDRDYLADNVSKIQAERSRLYQKLLAIPGITPFPSQSNFILCKVDGKSARDVKTELAAKGVFIRHYENALLRDYIRISVGRPGDTDILIRQLEELL